MSKIRLVAAQAIPLALIFTTFPWSRVNVQAQVSRRAETLTIEPVSEISISKLSALKARINRRRVLRPLSQFPNPVKPRPLTTARRSISVANATDEVILAAINPVLPAARLVRKFESIRSTRVRQPSPDLAVGSANLIVSTNIGFQIYTKTGRRVGNLLDPGSFFAVSNRYDIQSDPKFIYDAESNRFFGVYIGFDSLNQRGAWFLAVSKTNSAAGRWVTYRILEPGKLLSSPGLGVCSDKLVLTANAFTASGFGFRFDSAVAVALNKSDLIAGARTSLAKFSDIRLRGGRKAFTIQPVHSLSPTSTCHMVSLNDFNTPDGVQVYKITGVPSSSSDATLKTDAIVRIRQLSLPPNAVQRGTSNLVETNDTRLLDATYRNVNGGSIWTASTTGCSIGGKLLACVNAVELRGVNSSPVKRQQIILGAANLFYYSPALRTDRNNNMTVVFTRSGATEFPSLRYTSHLRFRPLNTVQPSALLAEGRTFSSLGRWGGSFGAALDPSDTRSIWIYGEYKPLASSNQWGTYVGQTKIP